MSEKKYRQLGAYHWHSRKDSIYLKLVEITINQFPNKGSIIDLGCGDGFVTEKLLNKGLDVIGVDSSPIAIKLAKKHSKAKFILGDITKLDTNKKYDYALLQEVIEHLDYPEKIIPILKKIVKKYFVVSVPRLGFESEEDKRGYTDETLLDLFKDFYADLIEFHSSSVIYKFIKK